jgi:hypothetical protein
LHTIYLGSETIPSCRFGFSPLSCRTLSTYSGCGCVDLVVSGMNSTPSCRAIDAVVAGFVAALIISIIMEF